MTEIMKRKIILPDSAELDSLCSMNPDPITELTGKVVTFWADVENNGISVFAENKRISARIERLEEALRQIRDWDRMLIDPPIWQDGLLKDRRHFSLEDAKRIALKALLEE